MNIAGENLLSSKLFLSVILLFVILSFPFVGSVGASSEMWSQTYGGVGYESARSVVVTADGGYAIAGIRDYGGTEDNRLVDWWLVKTDEFGNEEWNRTYGGPYWDGANSLVETLDGGFALAGYTGNFSFGNVDFWLVKTDEFGNMEWNRTYGESDLNVAYSLVVTSDGGYAMAGETRSLGSTSADFWLVKTDETGFIPEHSSFILSSLLMTVTLVIVTYKKKLLNQP